MVFGTQQVENQQNLVNSNFKYHVVNDVNAQRPKTAFIHFLVSRGKQRPMTENESRIWNSERIDIFTRKIAAGQQTSCM